MTLRWGRKEAVKQIEEAGFKVTVSREARPEARFLDVGAVVYYLKEVPWQVPGFSTSRYHEKLRELDLRIRRDGSFHVTLPRFLVHAIKATG